jgi:hypothetical protein
MVLQAFVGYSNVGIPHWVHFLIKISLRLIHQSIHGTIVNNAGVLEVLQQPRLGPLQLSDHSLACSQLHIRDPLEPKALCNKFGIQYHSFIATRSNLS